MARFIYPAALALGALLSATHCTADYACSASRSLSQESSMDGVSRVEIRAGAGSLAVQGGPQSRLTASGRACTTKRFADRLDEIRIVEERDGSTLRIIADIPTTFTGSTIGALDLSVTLPDNVPVRVVDSSGDADISALAELSVRDSSGDLEISDIAGDVTIERDSSGDIDLARAGNVRIDRDSSGDIVVREAASLDIGSDSSGAIRATDIAGNVRVGSDTSGSIAAVRVSGDFEVGSDTSGDITVRDVSGRVSTPKSRD